MDKLNIILCSDQPILRSALRLLVESRPAYRVTAETAVSSTALVVPEVTDVHMALLDFDLSDSTRARLDALQAVLAPQNVPVLILTNDPDAEACKKAFEYGARGLVLKTKGLEDLFGAIDRVGRGESWLEGPALAKLLRQSPTAKKASPQEARIAELTRREREIIEIVAQGRTNQQIAQQLFIAGATVRHHLCAIFEKLGVATRGELMVFAYRHHLADRSIFEQQSATQ